MRGIQKRITVTVRMSRDEELLLRHVARRRHTTVSEVIRTAVGDLARAEAEGSAPPFQQIADLVGTVRGLPADLSERSGDRFAEAVRTKAGRRK